MKAETIRLAVAMLEASDEEESEKPKALEVIDLDDGFEEAGTSTIKILGDGEDSGDDQASEEHGVDPIKPETILALAYIQDPKLFDRDAETRRSKPRADLKGRTGNDHGIKVTLGATKIFSPGWTDEQIEGWRIMLDRNVSGSIWIHSNSHGCTLLQPKKDRILQKHEFSGNRVVSIRVAGGTGEHSGGGQRGGGGATVRGRGRGRGGRGRGRGGGGGGRSGPGEKTDEVVRERAFKEKHKSSNRKRGHDKKMTKAGAGPSA